MEKTSTGTYTGGSSFTYTISSSVANTQVKFLQGKVLTVIDASFADKEQRNAVKSLINQIFSEQMNRIENIAANPTEDSASK